MWKWFMLFWLAPLRITLTQPVLNENTRSTRQLNFEECCPCLNSGSPQSHDVFGDTMEKAASADNCPCWLAPDSESASSIFTPALRAVDPLIRSGKEKNSKPLLNPEVGLASSVLETLREVTDQEYQDALVRDAAKSARKDIDENVLDQESTLNAPRNIVNIILQPKEEDTFDTIPEASHVQETRCIYPTKKSSNSFNYEKLNLSNKPLWKYSPLTTLKSGKKYFDMTNSASNVHEHTTLPLKNSMLENYKKKSDLLKMKLFSNSKNSFKETNTDFDSSNQLNMLDYNNNRAKQIPNFKLASIFDLINASKQKKTSSLTSNLKDADTNEENDFKFSPSNHQNYDIRNNERNPVDNAKPLMLNVEEPQKSDLYLKESATDDKPFRIEHDLVDLTNPRNLKTNNDLTRNMDLIDKNNYKIRDNDKQFISKGDNYNDDNIDAVSSPSEINTVKEPLDRITDSENYTGKECEISHDISATDNKDITKDIQKLNLLNETIPEISEDTTTKDDSEMITTIVETDNVMNQSSEENVCNIEDLETGASNDEFQKTNTEQENKEKIGVYESNERNNQLLNAGNSLETVTDKVVSKNALSNIKNDIFKTFENVKKINKNIHERLKSNVLNALSLDVINNNFNTNMETTTSIPRNIIQDENVKVDDNISIQDLQEMSDRLLNLSVSDNKVEMQGHDSKDIINTIRKPDFNTTPLGLNNIAISSTPSFQSTESTAILRDSIGNYDEIIDETDDTPDSKDRNKNPCQNISSKKLDQTRISLPNNEGKEMISEASSPITNSVPYTNQNLIVQPNFEPENQKPNVRMFLDNFKSSLSDIFNDNKDTSRNVVNNDEQPFSESRNIDTYNSFSNKLTQSHILVPNKINNLNSYKAKVATPDSLKIKAMPSFTNRKESTFQQKIKNIPENRLESKSLRDYLEKPNFSQTRNAQGDYSPGLNLQNLSENLKSRTDEALRNIQDSFDDFHNSHIKNQNNILEKIPVKTNIFRTSQSNDLNKRLQDFNSDVRNRLSLMSQRIQDASILPSYESPIYQTKNKLYNNDRLKSTSKPNSHVKNDILLKSKQNTRLNQKIPQPTIGLGNKNGILKTSHIIGDNLRNIGENTKFKSELETKTPFKKDHLRRPLKESKLGVSFLTKTERPDLMKSRSNSKPLSKSPPPIMRSNLPKTATPLKSSLQKRLELMSKLKPFELQPLASDKFSSRIALPDRKINNSKLLPFSGLKESMIQQVDDISEESSKSNRFPIITNPVDNASENVGLSKIRDAIKIKSSNSNKDKKFTYSDINNLKSTAILDPSQSASNNMNTVVSSVIEKPLKENVSYKCKMICYEDNSQLMNR